FSAALHGGLLLCEPARRALVGVRWAAVPASPAPRQTLAALYVTALHTARPDDQGLSVCYDARAARTSFGNQKEAPLAPSPAGRGDRRPWPKWSFATALGRNHGSR